MIDPIDMWVFKPENWFWIVSGDESRFWSSAAGDYVPTLPDGAGITRIASEQELAAVLAVHALQGPVDLVPDRVSPAQAEIALHRHDDGVLLGQVNALIDSYPYEPVRIWWRKATFISRDHPYLAALAIELGLSDETVDGLFVAAGKIS
ncbi:hypothetical protein EDC40_103635 [Aminobacter aminovorans]|uniref:Uncharacterized protein n=1 Tax=Aminobacter aminovorans TaxID=83263 RepID=A0A380WKG6_AMIAI|nr:hypothetical protein [Aminobacter aminovorans]TCS28167.1 hypothetical protein EDC40_103635 [Aminobacter aminovorans]SUU89421.1 Uncharacterised protein [Aminobacter aminovorans]